MKPLAGLPVDLYKHKGQSRSGRGATSDVCDDVVVMGMIDAWWSGRNGRMVYELHTHQIPGLLTPQCLRLGIDVPMVLIRRQTPTRRLGSPWLFSLHEASIEDEGSILFTPDGMPSGVWGNTPDARWNELVGGPVQVYDLHEFEPAWIYPQPL